MENNIYIENALKTYNSFFDIHRNYDLEGEILPAYCCYFSRGEKYVLIKSAQLWATENFEHVIFLSFDNLTESDVEQVREKIKRKYEPKLVKPTADHMYSYITIVLTCKSIDENAANAIKKMKLEKNYMFSFRGWSSARVVAIDLMGKKVYNNVAAKKITKTFQDVLK